MLGSGARRILINTHFSVETDRRVSGPSFESSISQIYGHGCTAPITEINLGRQCERWARPEGTGTVFPGGGSVPWVPGAALGGASLGGRPGTPRGTGRAAVLRWGQCGSGCPCPTGSGRAPGEGETVGAGHVQ